MHFIFYYVYQFKINYLSFFFYYEQLVLILSNIFLILTQGYVSWILEREEGRGKEREKHGFERETSITGFPHIPQKGDQTHNLGMCPDWE